MTIPYDPLGRCWIEVSPDNPALVEGLRPCLLSFLAYGPGRVPSLAGTGFIIAGVSEFALVITAKHVLSEGVLKIQKPNPSHSASALFIPESTQRPKLEPENMKLAWFGGQSATFLDAAHVTYNNSLDISACVIIPQKGESKHFKPASIPIDTGVPVVGEVVHMVSQSGLQVSEKIPPRDSSGGGQLISMVRHVSVRVGVVTGVYQKGHRQYKWPCFTTSIPAEPGMSGGFVYLPREDQAIGACGIICADNSPDEARSSFFLCGESVVASAWPALCLNVPISYPVSRDTATQTIYKMIRSGTMGAAIGGIDHIEIIETGNGDCRIRRL